MIEAKFNIDELFFSKTDSRGIIESGNSVFLRVSEYSEEELLHKPHNIIRHPDMPRAIFKLLWDFLKSGKPIVAYVKNRSKSGRFYWVLAMAFPMQDGYLSIRLKPSSEIFEKVKALYGKMLELEKTSNHSMDLSTQLLNETLTALNYPTYESFMMEALVTEFNSRDTILSGKINKHTEKIVNKFLAELVTASKYCTESVRSGFEITNELYKNLQQLNKHKEEISFTCQNVSFTTVNLTISSAKAGEAGKPLSVVATNLDKLTHDISMSTENLQKTLHIFQQAVKEMNFNFAISRFQIEMMNQLIQENIDLTESESIITNINLLCLLVGRGFENVEKSFLISNKATRSLLQACKDLKKTTAGMDVINVVGRIEMVRIQDNSLSLISILEEMEDLTSTFKKSLRALEKECESGIASSLKIEKITDYISKKLKTLKSLQDHKTSC